MPRRAPSTLADYLVVAISPALIMLLVGSLMFFLIEVFYQGQYGLRLWFIMAMFVMAIVCVARISMEEGAGYASLFGAPLALVSLLALARFVQISGPLAAFSLLINAGLMALVWWAAHKLTWDCTLIDDTQDASGQGLLQELGVDPTGGAPSGPAGTSMPAPAGPAPLQRRDPRAGAPDEAVSGVANTAASRWWQRWLEADRRPHAPGLWVVYFSLAALPLFGIGGWFIPAEAADARQRAMLFLVIYVASGLALLLATSFLGLRRYLRQRWLEMPLEMAATWVGLGLAMIVATLALCYVLPRPDSLARVADLPVSFTSPDRTANPVAAGPEGAKQASGTQSATSAPAQPGQSGEKPGARGQPGERPESTGDSGAGGKSSSNSPQQNQTATAGKSAGSTQDGPGGSDKATGSSAKGKDSTPSGSNGKPGADAAQNPGKDKQGNGKSGSAQGADDQGGGGQRDDGGNGGRKPGENAKASQDEKSPAASQSDSASQAKGSGDPADSQSKANAPQSQQAAQTPPPPPPAPRLTIEWGNFLPWLLRLLFFAVLAVLALWLAWRFRAEIIMAWRKLLEELRELWNRLFGGTRVRPGEAASAGQAVAVPRPFASFSDPFASGAAARMSWPELVRYTFLALEAWGREHGCPRAAGQTPHEFAAQLVRRQPGLSLSAPALADAYGQVAYAPQRTSPAAIEVLRSLWQQMRATGATASTA